MVSPSPSTNFETPKSRIFTKSPAPGSRARKTFAGLHVAVDDAGGVRSAEDGEELGDEGRRVLRVEPAAGVDALRERLALEQLHHQVAPPPSRIALVEHLDDVGRADAARGLRLALEAGQRVLPLGDVGVQDLQRDATVDRDVLGLVDRSHRALADLPREAVLAGDDLSLVEAHGEEGSKVPADPRARHHARAGP